MECPSGWRLSTKKQPVLGRFAAQFILDGFRSLGWDFIVGATASLEKRHVDGIVNFTVSVL